MDEQIRKHTHIFSFQQFLHWFAVGIIIPVLTLLLMEKKLDLFQVGICMAVYTVTVFILEIPTGSLADQFGRVKVYLISIGFSILAMLILLLGQQLIFTYIGMGTLGVARSLSTGTLDAWFIDRFQLLSPKGNLQAAMARIEVWITIGLGCGSLLGGFLPMLATHYQQGTYSFNIALIAILNLCVAFYTILKIHDSHKMHWKRISYGFVNLPFLLKETLMFGFKNSGVTLLIVATAFWGFAIAGLENYWQPQVKNILGSDKQFWIFGILSSGYFFAAALGSLLITPICKLYKNRFTNLLFFFRMSMGFSFIVLAIQNSIIGFSLVYFLLFMQNGMLNSPHQSLFHGIVPANKRSTLISLESFMLSIGAMAGSLTLGWVAKSYSISACWVIAGIVLGLSGFCYIAFGYLNTNPLQHISNQLAED